MISSIDAMTHVIEYYQRKFKPITDKIETEIKAAINRHQFEIQVTLTKENSAYDQFFDLNLNQQVSAIKSIVAQIKAKGYQVTAAYLGTQYFDGAWDININWEPDVNVDTSLITNGGK